MAVEEEEEEEEEVSRQMIDFGFGVELPALAADDPLLDAKMKLLKERELLTSNLPSDKMKWVDKMLEIARILQLNGTEFYFLEDDERGPFSPRNELESLTMILSAIPNQSACSSEVKQLENILIEKLNEFEQDQFCVGAPCRTNSEEKLVEWAVNQGLKTNICIAEFEGFGRGAAAISDIEAGQLVLEVPASLLISDDVAMKSDMGKIFETIEDLSNETIALLWSMREYDDPKSNFAPYFDSLPKSFCTGLSFGVDGLKSIEGTLAFEQIMQTKKHIREQYDILFPDLTNRYPQIFPAAKYTWERFLWTSELWYSNSVKVKLSDGKIQTCLIPVLGFLNHSVIPHVTHYGKLDKSTKSLKLHSLRHCGAGQQCFLSYGTLPNTDFLCFYGFVLNNNPYDTIPFDLDIPEDASDSPFKYLLAKRYDIESSHMVRAPCLSTSSLGTAGLPTKLLAALRIAFMDEEEAENFAQDPRLTMVSIENERAVVHAISHTFETLLQCLQPSNDDDRWESVLADEFKRSQRQILEALIQNCASFLNEDVNNTSLV